MKQENVNSKIKIGNHWFDKKRSLILLGLFLLVIVLLVVLLLIIPKRQLEQTGTAANEFEALKRRELDSVQIKRAHPLGDALLFVSGEEVVVEDYQEQHMYAYEINFQRPVAMSFDNYVACGDREGTGFVVFSKSAAVFEVDLEGSFASCDRSDDGYWVVLDEQAEGNSLIHLLSEVGQRIYTLNFAKSGNPISVAFTRDGQFIDIILLDTSSSQLKSLLRRYNREGSLVAQKALEGHHSLFYGISHDRDDNPVVFSSTEIVYINYNEELPIVEETFASVLGVFTQGDTIYTFADTQNDGYYSVYAIDRKGKVTEQVKNIGRVSNLTLSPDGKTLVYVANNVLGTYKMGDEDKGPAVALDGEISRYLITDGLDVNLVNSRGARLITQP